MSSIGKTCIYFYQNPKEDDVKCQIPWHGEKAHDAEPRGTEADLDLFMTGWKTTWEPYELHLEFHGRQDKILQA